MITVSILINGQPIYTRTAVNTGKKLGDGCTIYETDCNNKILHDADKGAIELAKKMLDVIHETK